MTQERGADPCNMDERLLDIVVFMVARLRDERSRAKPFRKLANDLQTMGFSEQEISSAYSWMFDRWGGKQDSLVPDMPVGVRRSGGSRGSRRVPSLRVLAPREQMALSAEATGYLFRLVELGILKTTDFEEIVEACVQSGRNSVTIDEMKVIVSGALFSAHYPVGANPRDFPMSHDESWRVN